LALFIGELPEDIDFINLESFYFYMSLSFPNKAREIGALMNLIEPYIPVIVSQRSLESILDAYMEGDFKRLTQLESGVASRSKLTFLDAAMNSDAHNWEEMVELCCYIRSHRIYGI